MATRVLRDKVFTACAAAFLVLSGLTLWQVADTEQQVDTLSSDLDTTEQRLDTEQERGTVLEAGQAEASRQARALLRQVRRNGLNPVVEPGDIDPPADTDPAIIEGEPGRPATPAEILKVVSDNPGILDAAIRRHCATTDCRGVPGESLDLRDALAAFTLYCNTRMECIGPRGRQGLPGPGPTDEQLTAILVAYCSTRNECIGSTGPQGDPGRAPTDEEIRAEVDAHCAEQPGGTCEGPQGEQGDQGPPGQSAFPFEFEWTFDSGDLLDPAKTIHCTVIAPTEFFCEET